MTRSMFSSRLAQTLDDLVRAHQAAITARWIEPFRRSVIAQADYGAKYFSDPKILLTFVLWLAYIAMIFIRRASGLRGRRAVYLSSFVVLVVLFVWAANQFSAVHRFPTP